MTDHKIKASMIVHFISWLTLPRCIIVKIPPVNKTYINSPARNRYLLNYIEDGVTMKQDEQYEIEEVFQELEWELPLVNSAPPCTEHTEEFP